MQLRSVTAILIILTCGGATAWGTQVVRFSLTQESLSPTAADRAALLQWANVPGLSGEALQRLLAIPVSGDGAHLAKAEELESLIASRPMSSEAWMSLAEEWFFVGRSSKQVNDAMALSRVTGPNEGAILWERGFFDLIRWNDLSVDGKKGAAEDVVKALVSGRFVGKREIDIAKAMLANRPTSTRAEIGEALTIAGLPNEALDLLGLRLAEK